MSTTYRAVAWNPQKRRYDLVAAGLLVAFLVVFLGMQATLRPELTIETLLIEHIESLTGDEALSLVPTLSA